MNFHAVKVATSDKISVTQLLIKVISFTHFPTHWHADIKIIEVRLSAKAIDLLQKKAQLLVR